MPEFRQILTKLENCKYRHGFTGTLDGTQTHRLILEGLFGTVEKVVSTKDLMDKNDDVQNHVADILGENNSEAKRITDTIMSQIVRSEREIKQRSSNNRQASIVKIGKRLKKFKEDAVSS